MDTTELGLAPPAAKHRQSAPTTITDITDDLLCEIFILLPSLPSLVRAAIACRTFLHAVRSSRAFRRRFQANHPPPLLGFFNYPHGNEIPTFTPLRSRSDPDLTAAVRGADFFLTRLPADSCNPSAGWQIASCHSGYLVLVNSTNTNIGAYNPFTQALDLFPEPPEQIVACTPEEDFLDSFLEFHIVLSEEDQGVFRMVSVQRRNMQGQVQACVAVFSSATREWKIFPWVKIPTPLQPEDDGEEMLKFHAGMQANGFIYWKHMTQPYVLILNTATLKFSRVDLPLVLGEVESELFSLSHTKDGKLCMVAADVSDADTGTLVVWFWRADDDGIQKWMFEEAFPLDTFIDVTKGNATVQVEAVIDGYVYLSAKYDEQPGSLLSLCLETGKVNKLFYDAYSSPAHLYIMAWPRSLIRSKEDSENKVTIDRAADDGLVGTEKPPSVLVAALKSYKEALINADEAKAAEIEAFFTSYRG